MPDCPNTPPCSELPDPLAGLLCAAAQGDQEAAAAYRREVQRRQLGQDLARHAAERLALALIRRPRRHPRPAAEEG